MIPSYFSEFGHILWEDEPICKEFDGYLDGDGGKIPKKRIFYGIV